MKSLRESILFAFVVSFLLGGCQWACEARVYEGKERIRKFMQRNCDALTSNITSMYKESLDMEKRLSELRCPVEE